ncbi:MAG: BMP family ABC transporter substrate-binding protein [Bacteroidetes bacterium]|nr:BMP family ABC transporter substrate-binding protein [Bacteroidota bacterium]
MTKNVKIWLVVLLIFAVVFPVFGGGSDEENTAQQQIRVALVTSTGGLGDRSFNDAAWIGFQRAQSELGVAIKVMEPSSVVDYETSLSTMADLGYDLVVGIGFDMKDAMTIVSEKYPDTRFATVNVAIDHDNISTAQFKDHEGSFLAGALAASMSKTAIIGFVGGVDAPSIRRFEQGYKEGAEYINPGIQVISSFVGSFGDPGKGKESALSMFSQNADIVFHAAGKTGEGVLNAASEVGKYAIGVDQDQDYIAPGSVLTSMVKRVDVAMFEFIKAITDGTLTAGIHVYGLKESGVGLSEMKFTKDLIPESVLLKLDSIKKKIISGEIVVTDVFNN